MTFNQEYGLTDMQQMATIAHELYLSYLDAGFGADQALRLVIATIQTTEGQG